jgi:hypothetical protein
MKGVTHDTDTSHQNNDSPLETLSSKLDIILDLLQQLLQNQPAQQIKYDTTQTILTGGDTAYLKKDASMTR